MLTQLGAKVGLGFSLLSPPLLRHVPHQGKIRPQPSNMDPGKLPYHLPGGQEGNWIKGKEGRRKVGQTGRSARGQESKRAGDGRRRLQSCHLSWSK